MNYNNEITTLADLTRVQASRFPDKKALIFKGYPLTYIQLNNRANLVAHALLAQGIKSHSRVGLLAKDSIKSYEILFGCSKINAVTVPINWRLSAPEVSYILKDANIEILFVGNEFHRLVTSISDDINGITIISLEESTQTWLNYDNWLLGNINHDINITVEPNDIAVQVYTSGTTGRPKGVQLTHYSLFAIFQEIGKQGETWIDWNESDKSLLTLPIFHIGGLWWAIRGLAVGAENILLEAFIAFQVFEAIEKYSITKIAMVPAMMQVLLAEPGLEETNFSSLQYIVYGGSPIAQTLLAEAMAKFPSKFVQVYGMTETGNCAVSLSSEDHESGDSERLKSVGKALPGVSLKIIDSNTTILPVGKVGEICIKSLANMVGYWKLPEATANTLIDGWIHTGDAGYLDEAGYLYICDRFKDMICYGGENIYPAEIENVLFEHPAVMDIAVIGVPDKRWGETIKAIVVLRAGMSATPSDLINFAQGKLANFKIPKTVEFTDSLPKTPSGKVQKSKLREKYGKGN
ncbi:MAG: long-chain-fatty-acid--CoA ligase [Gloeotrichia echinulata HAB0833]